MEKKRRDNKKAEALIQILVLVIATISFSYFAHESSYLDNGANNEINSKNERSEVDDRGIVSLILLPALNILNKILWNEKTLVSAIDSSTILNTCMKTKDGRTCVEYPADQCAENCDGNCISQRASTIVGCEVGTCYDSNEGICSAGAVKKDCEDNGGVWYDDPNGNVQVCNKGCCISDGQARFSTERACARNAEVSGTTENFKSEIKTESGCLLSVGLEKEGACVLGKDLITQKSLCKFVTQKNCNSLNGDFHDGVLCSNADLNTVCEKQKKTECVENKDEIYWFDSCGNKENIYSADTAIG